MGALGERRVQVEGDGVQIVYGKSDGCIRRAMGSSRGRWIYVEGGG